MEGGGTAAQRVGTAVTVSGDPGTSSLMYEVLTAMNFEVVEVQDGEQVINALRLEAPNLVVFDGDLNEMSVLNFLRLARPLLGARKVPVVLARDDAEPVGRAEGGELVEVVLNRPFTMDDLREAVTIARWAADRSNDPRVSGGARPSQVMARRKTAADPLPDGPRAEAKPSGSHLPRARSGKRPILNKTTPHAPADPPLRPAVQVGASGSHRADDVNGGRGEAELSAAEATTTPVSSPMLAIASGPGPQADTGPVAIQAPSAKKRFRRTLAFSAPHQPTAITMDTLTTEPTGVNNEVDGTAQTQAVGRPAHARVGQPPVVVPRAPRPTRREGALPPPRRRGALLQPGTLIADRYVVRDVLGTGGMAEVYRAHDRELEEEVALKLLKEDRDDPEIQARFRQEMRICRRLHHPAIVRTYEFGVWHSRRFITMEVLKGEDMARRLQRRGAPMEEEAVRRLFVQVCEGLHAAHAAGVIHRDVKPHNIFVLDGCQQSRLMDFGIAKSQDLTTTAEAGASIIGTPAYLPPERLRDGVEPTALTDLYSVGASMYHALTGQLPFGGKDISTLLTAILLGPLRPPRQVNPAISEPMQRLVLKAMAREPADRYADCATLAEALRQLA